MAKPPNTKTDADYKLLSVAQVAALTGAAESTVRDNMKKRRLSYTLSADGSPLIRRADAQQWAEMRKKPKRWSGTRGEIGA
jgi:hypothetical protein